MLSTAINFIRDLKTRFPRLYAVIVEFGRKFIPGLLGVYPRPLANELKSVARVLRSSKWNMTSGKGLAHEKLEESFADFIGVQHAIAVNTGGMALQMSMRALGLKPGDEVILQIDTCVATSFAVMNAGCTPIFSDISEKTFMLPTEKLEDLIGLETKALIATHMWGNPENMEAVVRTCKERDVFIIEDACLALGSISQGKMAGSQGHVGVFSFGCLKPIQGGEGGMIVTNDSSLARELRSLRHWGDRTIEYGVRDATQLAWNGRMSEIVAAVVHEQLKGYPSHLSGLRDSVSEFVRFISEIDGLELVLGESTSILDCAFTQVVLRIDEEKFGCSKKVLREALLCRGVVTWHANFELINSLSFFREDSWVDWVTKGDIERARNNYHRDFFVAQKTYESGGLGLPKTYFLSKAQLHNLKKKISIALIECKKTLDNIIRM